MRCRAIEVVVLPGALNATRRHGAHVLLERVDVLDPGSIMGGLTRLCGAGVNGVLLPGYLAEQIALRPELESVDVPMLALAPHTSSWRSPTTGRRS